MKNGQSTDHRNKTEVVSGRKLAIPRLRMWIRIATVITQTAGSLPRAYVVIRELLALKKQLFSKGPVRKLVHAGGRYFWNINAPGWPSPAFDQFFRFTTERLLEGQQLAGERVRLVMLSITKKCPMNCEHCFEWDEINKKEVLSLDQLKKIVDKYQGLGAAQFLLGGGEPMARYDDLIALLRSTRPTSDFWITTSGFNLTADRAQQLKAAGLTGVQISLDHFDKKANNAFRGRESAFDLVMEATDHANAAGLVVGWSICTTKSFISPDNLFRFADLASGKGVGFIQLLEPRAVGRYAGKDVELRAAEYAILDEFYLSVNEEPGYRYLPRVVHTSYNQRNAGCAGAGLYIVMIDTNGRVNACPFCRTNGPHALNDKAGEAIQAIQQKGCHKFAGRLEKSVPAW